MADIGSLCAVTAKKEPACRLPNCVGRSPGSRGRPFAEISRSPGPDWAPPSEGLWLSVGPRFAGPSPVSLSRPGSRTSNSPTSPRHAGGREPHPASSTAPRSIDPCLGAKGPRERPETCLALSTAPQPGLASVVLPGFLGRLVPRPVDGPQSCWPRPVSPLTETPAWAPLKPPRFCSLAS